MISIQQYPIKKELLISGFRVILFDDEQIPRNSSFRNRNVVCFDKDNNPIWQAEELDNIGDQGNDSVCTYVGIMYLENKLILFNWCCWRVVVDIKTGKILEKKYVK